jgi:hypothetical protein
MFLGMGIAVLVPVARIEVANSNAMIKMAVLGAAAFFAFIGVIVLWAKGDICGSDCLGVPRFATAESTVAGVPLQPTP